MNLTKNRVKGHIYLPRLAGLTSTQYRTSDLTAGNTGNSGTNPTEVMTLLIALIPLLINGGTQNFIVNLDFHAEFFDPLLLPPS